MMVAEPKRIWAHFALAAVMYGGLAQAASAQRPSNCEARADPSAAEPSRSIYCSDLISTPDLLAASGYVELQPATSPFGVAVSPDGKHLYNLVVSIQNLPDPGMLGAYSTYVAWASDLSFSDYRRLGEVGNGRTELGVIEYDQFRIFVSAEARAATETREGRLVLRGVSPSIFVQLDEEHLLPFLSPPPAAESHEHTVDHRHGDRLAEPHHDASAGWVRPPMRPLVPMLPAFHALEPGTTPFRPGLGVDPPSVPFATPSALVALTHGDTLTLEAGLVRRRILGRTVTMYGFNGQYPGPLISVDQGTTITVIFTNRIEMPTTVHWHGLRLDFRHDGVPGVTQEPVQPGETFIYEVSSPDAGIYWYHPHHREDIQQDLGLYGNMRVAAPEPDYFSPVNREEVLMLDDLLWTGDEIVPHGWETPTHALMGRFGNLFLVNGEPEYELTLNRGEVVRFFFTNASNARTFNLSIADTPLKTIGSDIGKFEREEWTQNVVLAPAERYIIEARFDKTGSFPITNRVKALSQTFGYFYSEMDTIGHVRVRSDPAEPDHAASFQQLRENIDVIADIDPYRSRFKDQPELELELTIRVQDMDPSVALAASSAYFPPVEWTDAMPVMNWLTTGDQIEWILRDVSSGRENMEIDWRFSVGDVVKLSLHNNADSFHPMAHPMHLHGQRFLVLSTNAIANPNVVWKDTALVPVGATVELLVDFSNPGRWMFHCHIAEHLSAGMMAVFSVDPPGTAETNVPRDASF